MKLIILFNWKIVIKTPETVTPAKRPPNVSAPNMNPTTTGEITASKPGATISLIADCVEISTHRPCSAFVNASS